MSGIQIKKLNKTDTALFKELVVLFDEVFQNESRSVPKKAYLQKLLTKNSFIAIVATYNNKVIGGLTAYELPMYYGKFSELLIYDMAVSSKHQRKGIGKKLITSLIKFGKKRGIESIFVPAHEEDEDALAFYKSTGGKAEKVIHFNYSAN